MYFEIVYVEMLERVVTFILLILLVVGITRKPEIQRYQTVRQFQITEAVITFFFSQNRQVAIVFLTGQLPLPGQVLTSQLVPSRLSPLNL